MADDQKPRSYRSPDPLVRRTPATAKSGNDPLAELARLIGQTDPFGEYGHGGAIRAAAPPTSAPPNFGPSDYFDSPQTSISAPPFPLRHPETLEQPQFAPPQRVRPAYVADQLDTYNAAPPYPETQPSDAHADAYGADDPSDDELGHEDAGAYETAPEPKRRMNIMAIAVVFAMAVIGTATAFGYRAVFGSHASGPPPVIKADTAPSKIVPPATAANRSQSKAIYDRVPDPQDEKLVRRDEKPVEVKPADFKNIPPVTNIAAPPAAAAPAPVERTPGNGVISSEPKRVHTITIRPDQPAGAPVPVAAPPVPPIPMPPAQAHAVPVTPIAPAAPPTRVANAAPAVVTPPPRAAEAHAAAPVHHTTAAPPHNGPLSLSPNAAAPQQPMRTAAVTAAAPKAVTHATGGYAVQVSSQRSEAEAEAAFRGLQAKYPNILGGRKPFIHKVDLGAKGTYYRTMIGPFASGNEATELCNGLRAAGGQCLIQRN